MRHPISSHDRKTLERFDYGVIDQLGCYELPNYDVPEAFVATGLDAFQEVAHTCPPLPEGNSEPARAEWSALRWAWRVGNFDGLFANGIGSHSWGLACNEWAYARGFGAYRLPIEEAKVRTGHAYREALQQKAGDIDARIKAWNRVSGAAALVLQEFDIANRAGEAAVSGVRVMRPSELIPPKCRRGVGALANVLSSSPRQAFVGGGSEDGKWVASDTSIVPEVTAFINARLH